MLGFRGMTSEKSGRLRDALQDLAASAARIEDNRTASGELMCHKQLSSIIVEDYIGLLADIHGSALEKELNLDAPEVSFALAEGKGRRPCGGRCSGEFTRRGRRGACRSDSPGAGHEEADHYNPEFPA